MATNLAAPPALESFSLHVRITVGLEHIEAFLAALKPAYLAVIAEPENVYFEVFQNPDNLGEFRFVEHWNASVEWFLTVQAKKEYYVPYQTTIKEMYVKPREIEIWKRMGGTEWRNVKL
ncbi:hypothetical protein CC86DRAFT_374248 [Ophiobolus disseminans]|uniref:ABM domain-containing protein n=1 Tax=Ophiobolus disseminans TaxID=1469910 RepID=A0A6A6ZHJ3_9PLEO|nr:hypothetical protein CC86DRAFT_374248 [Ophiobolus disseminans]